MIILNKSDYYSHNYKVKLIHTHSKCYKSILCVYRKLTLSLSKGYIKIFKIDLKNIIFK